MTFVTQSCLDEWGFYMGVTQMRWPLTHTTEKYFLENLLRPYGPCYDKSHLPKLYFWVWFGFTLGYFFFSFLFFSFYDLFISRWSDSSQIFWFFRARSIYRKKKIESKESCCWLTERQSDSSYLWLIQFKKLLFHFYMFRGRKIGIVRNYN